MLIDSNIKETYQPPTNHIVRVYKNTTTNHAYCYFLEDRRSLRFSAVNTTLREIGYNEINFLTFSSRANWCCYFPTATLVDREAAVRGDLNERAILLRIQDPRSLPIPAGITSYPYSREHSSLQSWDHASPVLYTIPEFSALASTVPVPHRPSTLTPALKPSVDINAIVKAAVQVILTANATPIAAKPPALSLAPPLTQPTGAHHPNINFSL